MTVSSGPYAITTKENHLSRRIIGCALRVHTILGPGLLESAYQACLAHELQMEGLAVETEVPLPVIYRGSA